MATEAQSPPPAAAFGPNEWLVDELYERYRADRNSVDPAWWDFFADYRPEEVPAPAPASPPPTASVAATPPAPSAPTTTVNGAAAPAASTPEPIPDSPNGAAPAAASIAPTMPPPVRRPPIPQVPTPDGPPAEGPPTGPLPIAAATPAVAEYAAEAPSTQGPSAATVDEGVERLRGPAARVVTNMEASLEVPTATSVRSIPAKLLVDNRSTINNQLGRERGGRVSYTHLIGYATVEALREMPEMNASYSEIDGKPAVSHNPHVNFGLAIDLAKDDGTRQLVVPNIKAAETLEFHAFWNAYEDLVRKARTGKLTADDFAGTTVSLTNPGGIGTVHSVPRLMPGQGAIVGVGAMDYPAEYQGAAPEMLADAGISKVLTLTSTYDHRIIQGAQSGEFLRLIHTKLIGADGFYDRVFASLEVPYEPYRWVKDNPEPADIKSANVVQLIHAYRARGHLMAETDPLDYRQRGHIDLDLKTYGLTLWDMDRTFPTAGFGGVERMNLRQVVHLLRESYCRTIGVEYMHIVDPEQREWLQQRLETGYENPGREEQLRILRRLNAAEAFETFLQTKYVGQKRFSLEGAESVIPLLDALLSQAADAGIGEVGIGMAHRGRLNVLANIAGKSYSQIFAEFEGNLDPRTVQGSGDVKYHLGTEGVFTAESGAQARVHLAGNPSHLEAVDGVLEGIVRAKQDRIDAIPRGHTALPVLVHGDAAFAGQGVVTETLNLAMLRGYHTGGTIHVVINNQVGFTTGTSNSRSTLYCTDVAKGFDVPIFHVNGDDPEACARVARIAFDYRQEFGRDVIIDMVCYRRRGHNEGDDPSMTQPVMYGLIEAKRSVRKLYTESLIGRRDITVEEAEEALRHYQGELERVFAETRDGVRPPAPDTVEQNAGLERPESQREDAGVMVGWQTAVEPKVLSRIGAAHQQPPEGFKIHPKLVSLLERREKMSREGGVDWGFAEILAFGSLLMEGTPIRMAGQDSRRGTFVQRHAVFHDRETGAEWTPLQFLSTHQAKFWIYDSALSEYAAMAFEYGYSVERPDALVLWEAQFGDFVNGAQTVMDEFISSAEQKWQQRSSVVILLPHGYEGQGPDHSSGRIERFLQLCAEDNMIVAEPSTPANYFHLLRRQAYARPRKPLIVFSPKSMLRHKAAVSAIEDFTTGTFRPVMPDPIDPAGVRSVLLCSGKIYWDLLAERTKRNRTDLAIVRLEQLYPLPVPELTEALTPFGQAPLTWVQDEPVNQGAWQHIHLYLPPALGRPISVVGRPEAASPASGSHSVHAQEQAAIIASVFER